MGRAKDMYMRREEIARGDSAMDMIREFGSVKAAREWLEQQEFWQEIADRVDVFIEQEITREPLSHQQWRADQISEGMPTPRPGRRTV